MGKVARAIDKENYAVDAAGNPVALQEHQVEAAHEAGFTPVTGAYAGELQQAQTDKDYIDEHLGTAGKALAGGVGGLLTLGNGAELAGGLGLLTKGQAEALGESGSYQAGNVAGMLLPAFLSGGETVAGRGLLKGAGSAIGRALEYTPAGMLGRAGVAAERLAGAFLPEAGIMGKLASPTIQMAARGATEGAIVNLAHTVSDSVIQNKPLAAQALLASGVDGALFGGLTGGILGGVSAAAGAGVDVVGGRIASGAGGIGAEGKAGTALRRLGATESKLASLAEREGDLVTPLKGYYKVIQDGGESLSSDTSAIRRAVQSSETKYGKIAEDALQVLQKENPAILDGRLSSVTDRIKTDIQTAFGGTKEYSQALKLSQRLERELGALNGTSVTEKVAGTKVGRYGTMEPTLEDVTRTTPATWQNWATTRAQLADSVHSSTGLQQSVNKTALNAFDDELQAAMQRANPELATKWSAAVTGQRQARELLEMTGKRAAGEAARGSAIHMNGADAATMGYSLLAGANPLVGAGIIAAKKLALHTQRVMEPAIAEAAYRSAIGANAAHAQVAIGQRISSTLKNFMTGTRIEAEAHHAKSDRQPYTMANYQKSMDLADELTSAAHQAKVREMTSALATSGHPELAQEMANTYGRAVAYINQNKPKRGAGASDGLGKLGKPAKSMGLTTQGMKFMRQLHSMTAPVDAIMGGLERGDVSRDAVAAVKYVFPDLHQDIVMRASQQVVEMKSQGKFLPADKIAMIGTVLDAPIDTTLSPEFINEIQKAHAANNAPPPENGNIQPPQTDITPYQTPLQSSV